MPLRPTPTAANITQACLEALLTRIRDLEADNAALRDTLHASVALSHQRHEENVRLKTCLARDLADTYGVISRRRAA